MTHQINASVRGYRQTVQDLRGVELRLRTIESERAASLESRVHDLLVEAQSCGVMEVLGYSSLTSTPGDVPDEEWTSAQAFFTRLEV